MTTDEGQKTDRRTNPPVESPLRGWPNYKDLVFNTLTKPVYVSSPKPVNLNVPKEFINKSTQTSLLHILSKNLQNMAHTTHAQTP